MAQQARNTSKITDCRKTMIIRFRACSLLRHDPQAPFAGRPKPTDLQTHRATRLTCRFVATTLDSDPYSARSGVQGLAGTIPFPVPNREISPGTRVRRTLRPRGPGL